MNEQELCVAAMRQYESFKSNHSADCVLFFRMGDFYETVDADAVLCHKLTHSEGGVPMAGVPYHSVESYLRRMIEAGHRVALCEKVQQPAPAQVERLAADGSPAADIEQIRRVAARKAVQ